MYKKLNKVIMKHPKDAFINQEHLSNEWKKFNYIHEPDYIKAHQEFEQFLAIMKEHVAEIEFLPATETVGLDSLYAHDPVKFTTKGAIILNQGKSCVSRRQKHIKVFYMKRTFQF